MDTIREVNRQIADTVLMLPDSLVVIVGRQIIETARPEQIPVMFHEGTWAEWGDWPLTARVSLTWAGRRRGIGTRS